MFLLLISSAGAEEKALGRYLNATLPDEGKFLFLPVPLFSGRPAHPDTLIPFSGFKIQRGRTASSSVPPLLPNPSMALSQPLRAKRKPTCR
jgi:hypothetical protein